MGMALPQATHGAACDLRPANGAHATRGEDVEVMLALAAHPKGPRRRRFPANRASQPWYFGAAARRDNARARCNPPQQYTTTSTHITPSHHAWKLIATRISPATPTSPIEAAIIRLRA